MAHHVSAKSIEQNIIIIIDNDLGINDCHVWLFFICQYDVAKEMKWEIALGKAT